MRRFASAASLSLKVPDASVLAQTSSPASRRESARNDVPRGVSCGLRGQEEGGGRGRTNFCHDTGEDYLFLPCGLDGSAKVRVVPCVDLALAVDECCVGVHL